MTLVNLTDLKQGRIYPTESQTRSQKVSKDVYKYQGYSQSSDYKIAHFSDFFLFPYINVFFN